MRSEPKTEIGLTEMPASSRTVAPSSASTSRSRAFSGALLELDAGVEVLGVLAHDHDVGLGEARAHALVGLAGPDARVEVELLAQQHVDRAKARADRRGGRALDADLGALDRVQRRVGERVAVGLVLVDPGLLAVPLELHAGRLEHSPRGLGELGSGSVAGDEGDFVGHVDLRVLSRRERSGDRGRAMRGRCYRCGASVGPPGALPSALPANARRPNRVLDARPARLTAVLHARGAQPGPAAGRRQPVHRAPGARGGDQPRGRRLDHRPCGGAGSADPGRAGALGLSGQREPAGPAHPRPLRQPHRRGRVPPRLAPAHAHGRRERAARAAVAREARRPRRARRAVHDRDAVRGRLRLSDHDDLRGRAGAARAARAGRGMGAAAHRDDL